MNTTGDHITYIDEASQALYFHCPGCDRAHAITYRPGGWTWNGDRDRPTIKPSVLSNAGGRNPEAPVCHSYVTDGRIEYLGDSTHGLAGQTVGLPRW